MLERMGAGRNLIRKRTLMQEIADFNKKRVVLKGQESTSTPYVVFSCMVLQLHPMHILCSHLKGEKREKGVHDDNQ